MPLIKILGKTGWELLKGAVATEQSPGEYEIIIPIDGFVKDGYHNDKKLRIDGRLSTQVVQGNTRRSTTGGGPTRGTMTLHVLVDLQKP